MAKAQGKKAAGKGKAAAKKVAARSKKAAIPAKKKAAKKPAPPAKKAKKKPAKPAKPVKASAKRAKAPAKKKPAKKTAKAPIKKKAAKKPVKKAAKKAVKKAVKKASKKAAKAPAKKPVKSPAKVLSLETAAKAVTKVAKSVAKTIARPMKTAKAAARPAAAAPAPVAAAPVAVAKPIVPKPVVPKPAGGEKKRGRRARPRVHSNGAPAAAWLSTEKPRPASFIPAPPRAEAPSAIAAPPASSDRLIRPEDVAQQAVRTVPVRIDIEQGAGRFYVIANPMDVTVRVGEGIEWDFRYIGGADVTVEEIVIEFEKPSPFARSSYKTRKPGGARPHRQLSDGALPAAAGRTVPYTVRAMTPFKTEVASTRVTVHVV